MSWLRGWWAGLTPPTLGYLAGFGLAVTGQNVTDGRWWSAAMTLAIFLVCSWVSLVRWADVASKANRYDDVEADNAELIKENYWLRHGEILR